VSRRVLVTGAGGYLGGRIVRALAVRPDCQVRAGVRRHVPWIEPVEQVIVIPDDELPNLVTTISGTDALIHLAVPNEIAMSSRPDKELASALSGARRIAEACRRAGVSRIVYASTVHVYGAAMTPGAELTEEVLPAPRDHYAIARLASEYIISAAAQSEVEVVILRLTNVVGAPADPAIARWSLLANDLCRQASTYGVLRLRTHGMQCRDFLSMADACRLVEAATGLPVEGVAPVPPSTYNGGSGRSMTVRDLAGLVQDAWERRSGRRPPLIAPDPPATIPALWRLSIGRLRSLGFEPSSTIDSALDETVCCCLRASEARAPEGTSWAR
jgi:UDP-glucose 4-epimerase